MYHRFHHYPFYNYKLSRPAAIFRRAAAASGKRSAKSYPLRL